MRQLKPCAPRSVGRSIARSRASRRGFTLVELAVTLAIAAFLAVAGLPAYADYIENARLREGANLIVSGTLLARSEAIKRNLIVQVRVDNQRLVVTQDDGGTVTLIRSIELPPTMLAGGFTASYDSAGRLAPFGTPDIQVPVSSTHRTCDADIRCPTVLLQTAGMVNLCRTGTCT